MNVMKMQTDSKKAVIAVAYVELAEKWHEWNPEIFLENMFPFRNKVLFFHR